MDGWAGTRWKGVGMGAQSVERLIRRRSDLEAWLRRAAWADVARKRGLRVRSADVQRQALVLLARYGVAPSMGRAAVAVVLGVQPRRVWQVEQHSLRVLRKHPHEWTLSLTAGQVGQWPGLLRAVFDVHPGAAVAPWCCPEARRVALAARCSVAVGL